MSAIIYIEGGGDSNQDLERLFRRSWTTFFKAAGLSGHLPRIVRGGGRDRTFDLFARAIKHPDPKRVPLLLVDSEDPVKAGHSVWQHLQVRDGWDQTPGAGDDQAFMMVQAMETWFLADRDSLKRYFDAEFREERSQAMAAVRRRIQGDGPQRARTRHRQLRYTLCQRQGLVRVAGAG